jgi:protein phosphatase
MIKEIYLKIAGRSDIGLARSNNEDSGFIGKNIFLVADGMGGHADGELASATAVSIGAKLDQKINDESDYFEISNELVSETSKQIKAAINKDLNKNGMGTTLTAGFFLNQALVISHVGDSRLYLIRDKEIKQITKDQTYIQSLLDNNEITIEESLSHPQKSLLLQAIDGSNEIVPEILKIPVQVGDRIILCSDGLSNVLNNYQILDLTKDFDQAGAVSALIEKSLELGAPDNVTVIVADVVSEKTNIQSVVLGAAAEPRNRMKLPNLDFPTDIHPFITSEFPALKTNSNTKRITILLVSSLLIGLLVWVSSNWISNQFYVGKLGENIAIFQGLNSNLGSVSFSRPVQSFDLDIKVLTPDDQMLLDEGIKANSLTEARFIVRRLDLRALCARDSSFSFCPDVIKSLKPQ